MNKSARKGRLYYFTWIVIALFCCAGLTQADLQVVDRSAVLNRAQETKRFTLTRKEYARRGAIYASDGRPLAVDQDTYELGINFNQVPQTDAFFVDLSQATGIPATDFSQEALNGVDRKVWHDSLSASQRRAVQEVKTRWKADGISLDPTGKRTYPLGESAATVVGTLMDQTPKVGLELSQNSVLKGVDGITIGETDRTGNFLPMRLKSGTTPKQNGQDVTLTLDTELQQEAANQIKDAVIANKADNGVVVIMEPGTGNVLAMASYPTFDPSGGEFMAPPGTRRSTKNPVIQDRLEPGSMFKVLTLAKALNDGKVDPNARIDCTGELDITSAWRVHCAVENGTRAHGMVDAEQAIAKSCNVSAATWALRIGYDPMVQYIEDLGLLKPTGIGLPYESHGTFNFGEYAKKLQLATVGFGQSITATPIELASAFCMVANHGVQVKPRLIEKVGNQVTPVVTLGQRVSSSAADQVFQIMEKVIQDRSGTGFSLRIPGYTLAGKTGTAQRLGKKDGGGYISNFMGFVPAPNPRAMILVMIDHPTAGKYYGAAVAGPVWENLAKCLIRRYHIPPNDPASLHLAEQAEDNSGGRHVELSDPAGEPRVKGPSASRHAHRASSKTSQPRYLD